MSFFGDIAKFATKGFKKFKEVGGEIAKATRVARPLIRALPVVGQPLATGLEALDPGVRMAERSRKQAGRPARDPGKSIAAIGTQFLSRGLTIAQRLREGRLQPRESTPLVTPKKTPAFQRTVPGRTLSTRLGQPQRPVPMAGLQPARVVRAQPAAFMIPEGLTEQIAQTGRELLARPSPVPRVGRGAFPSTRQPTPSIVPLSASVDKLGRPLVVSPGFETRVRCPPGYLAVTMPDGSRACVLAPVAVAAGLAKRRRKPLISVKETRAMQVADRARGKLKRVTTKAGFRVTEKRTSRRRSSG